MASCHRDDQQARPTVRQRDPCHGARRDLRRGERSDLRHAAQNDPRRAAQNDPRREAQNDLRHEAPNDLRHAVLHGLRHAARSDLHCGVDVRHPYAARDVLRRDVHVFLPCAVGFFPRRDGLHALLLADAQHPGEPCGREPRHGERPYLALPPCAQRVLAA